MKVAAVLAVLAASNVDASGGVLDDILKVVCRLMENGSSESEAEELICNKLKYSVEVAACDKVVDTLWKAFENKECTARASSMLPEVVAKFEDFRTKWGRVYTGKEYVQRLGWFGEHLQKVKDLQQRELGTAIYTHLGPFADRSPEEMSHRFGLVQTSFLEEMQPAPILNATLGSSLDWVAQGAVNPVKDQGQCGSCWAFSTACNLESVGFVSGGPLVSLSEQNIMDCDSTCYSCNGGLPSLALTWSSQNGVARESSYPYTAQDGSCRRVAAIAHNSGYQKVSQNEDQIAQVLASVGPLSIAVDATPFQSYQSGILNSPSCSKTKIDHAVNIVGYGSDWSGTQYWKIRNSWSASWGEEGYIRVIRGNCMCALCTTVVTATGVTISGGLGVVV